MFEKIIQDIQNGYDALVKKCFEECGFSEDFVKGHPENFEVFVEFQSGFREIKKYWLRNVLDGVDMMTLLFKIETDYSEKIDFGNDDSYMIRFYPTICYKRKDPKNV